MFGLVLLLSAAAGFAIFDAFDDDDDNNKTNNSETDVNDESETQLGDEDNFIIANDNKEFAAETFDREFIDENAVFMDGPLNINTGNGDDEVIGSTSNDVIETGDGENFVFGGAGDDLIRLGDGDDLSTTRIDGADDLDLLRVAERLQAGDDTIEAGRGDDQINDLFGSNTLFGRQGDDFISTVDFPGSFVDGLAADESTPDTVFGGFGSDDIHSDDGDIVTTGEGRDSVLVDVFGIEDGIMPVTVTDFDPENDTLTLEGSILDLRTPAPTGPDDIVTDPITVADNEAGTGATVFVDGVSVVHLNGGQGLVRGDILLST